MSPPPDAAAPTVLVVDDDDSARFLARLLLERAGFSVLEATDGPEALEVAQGGGAGLVVLDSRMPRMDGLQVLAALRAEPTTTALPVLFLTAGSADEQDAALAAGASAFACKPVAFDAFIAQVRDLLGDG